MKHAGKYEVLSFPASRIGTIDIGKVGLSKHYIAALIELDITQARRNIREKRASSQISFTAWLVKSISHAIANYPQLHGVRKGKRKTLIFHDIDISIMVERKVQGEKVPLPYIIRKTNEKSIAEIHDEIHRARTQEIHGEGDYVLGKKNNAFLMKLYYAMPGCLRRMAWHHILRDPFSVKRMIGTVMMTSIGMAGTVRGWVIPRGIHPLVLAVSSIVKKPGVVGEQIEIREYLPITVLVDHDVIDGAPAARALTRLARIVEKGDISI